MKDWKNLVSRPDAEAAEACRQAYGEQAWIDWLLGHTGRAEMQAMERHLAECTACRAIVSEWRPLLGAAAEPRSGRAEAEQLGRHAAACAARRAFAAEGSPLLGAAAEPRSGRAETQGPLSDASAALPSASVRRSLLARVRLIGLRRRLRDLLRRKRRWLYGATASLLLGLAIFSLMRTAAAPEEQRSHYVAERLPEAAYMMGDPATASFRAEPANRSLGEGFIWYNIASGEAVVLLEGFMPSEGYVVQAWAVRGSARANLGLMRQNVDRAHLYIRDRSLSQADNISLTIEPSGGSDSPTSPEALIFRLPQR